MKLIHTKYEEKGTVAWITLCNPQKMNALTTQMLEDLFLITDKITREGLVRAAIVTGEGAAFCAGGELEELQGCYGGNSGFARHMDMVSRLVVALAELPIPVIAAVNGAAVGAGMNIALACDLVLASEKATFSEIFSNIGLVPDLGGVYFLPRLVGRQKAKELIFTAKMLSAQDALTLGIASSVYPPDLLLQEAETLATTLAAGPTAAYAYAKKMINKSFEMDLKTALDYEGMSQALASGSEDFAEGLRAFSQKRKPNFRGR